MRWHRLRRAPPCLLTQDTDITSGEQVFFRLRRASRALDLCAAFQDGTGQPPPRGVAAWEYDPDSTRRLRCARETGSSRCSGGGGRTCPRASSSGRTRVVGAGQRRRHVTGSRRTVTGGVAGYARVRIGVGECRIPCTTTLPPGDQCTRADDLGPTHPYRRWRVEARVVCIPAPTTWCSPN